MKYDPHNIFTFPQCIEKACQHYQLSQVVPKLFEKSDENVAEQPDDASYRRFRYVSRKG